MSRLKELLEELGKHGDLFDAYVKDPHSVLEKYQCTDEEKKAMLAKDVEKLKKLTGMENLVSNDTVKAYRK
ncbi:MAG: hypothetical protein Kow0020_09150 [Wenzhouxiangellaceae bacterium]